MSDKTEVLYNASCPICSREVNHYARLTEKEALPITYDDLADPERLALWGIDLQTATKRFHVRKAGQIHSGVDAFIVLWRDIPQMRWLANVFSLPIVHFVAVKTYDLMLAPVLYRMHLRRKRLTRRQP